MAYDGLLMAAVASELHDWCDARVERVFQPEATTLNLLIHHAQHGKARLLLSANPRSPRVHLTDHKQDNPPTPPMFCMLLRKHLEGAKLVGVEQLGLERVLTLSFYGRDELGNVVTYRLIAEIMGRHSNIALVAPDGKIIDSILRVPPAVSSVRIMLPGIIYEYPSHQARADTLTLADCAALQAALSATDITLGKSLVRNLTGISPLLANELLARVGLPSAAMVDDLSANDWQRLWQEIVRLQTDVRTANFSLSRADHEYAALELTHLHSQPWDDSVNRLVDQAVHESLELAALQQAKRALAGTIKQQLQKEERKLKNQERELNAWQQDLELRISGELILANLHLIKPKARLAELINYYDPQLSVVTVNLDPSLDAPRNAQRYFRRYERARKGIPIVEKNIATTRRTLQYLHSLQDSLERADTLGLVQEIRTEMLQNGLLSSEKQSAKKEKQPVSAPLHFHSPSGREILVGRNNLQNERLLRSAAPDDWWLHAKDIPGSHVLIKGPAEPDAATLELAAGLAAYFSKARQGSKVPVDYTRRRYVKKPSGSPPGYVIYTEQRTLLTEPISPDLSKTVITD